MSELLLSYAAFSYYTNERNYKIQRHIEGCISFWYDGENKSNSHQLQIITGLDNNDCGYVVVNTDDLETIFNKDDILITELEAIARIHRNSRGKVILDHCRIPRSIREKMVTKIHTGDEVRCKRI